MTAQVSVIVSYNGKEYALATIVGKGLFNPTDYSLKPTSWQCTSFHNGYTAHYEINEADLALEVSQLYVFTKNEFAGRPVPFYVFAAKKSKKVSGKTKQSRSILYKKKITKLIINVLPQEINGVKPEEDSFFDYSYQNLHLKLKFTGILLLGDEFISKLYVHAGFQHAWKYKTVIALQFKRGKLIGSKDISKVTGHYRSLMKKEDVEVKNMSFVEWVGKRLSIDQTLSKKDKKHHLLVNIASNKNLPIAEKNNNLKSTSIPNVNCIKSIPPGKLVKLNKYNIINIDDDELFVEFISTVIDVTMSIKTINFTNPLIALDFCKKHRTKINLIITGFKMPGITGIELISSIDNFLLVNIPVIMHTSDCSNKPKQLENFIKTGKVHTYPIKTLIKPFHPNELIVAVKGLLYCSIL
jgi:CheY-like chemotaxis protein